MVRYPTAALLSRLFLLVGATVSDPSQWPGLDNLPLCVQNVFQGCLYDCAYGGCIPCDIGCGDWTCACGKFSGAMSAASSVAATGCTSQTDIASATSIVNGFCGQLLASLTGPTAPTLPPTASPTSSSDSSGSSTGGTDFLLIPFQDWTNLIGAPPSGGGGGGMTTTNKIVLGVSLPGAILPLLLIWAFFFRWLRKVEEEGWVVDDTLREVKSPTTIFPGKCNFRRFNTSRTLLTLWCFSTTFDTMTIPSFVPSTTFYITFLPTLKSSMISADFIVHPLQI